METNQTAPEPGTAPDDAKGDSASHGGPGDAAVGSAPSTAQGSTDGAYGATQAENGGDGFFGWLRRLGVPRRQGWLGGVSAGIAARLGIDPIIVRGIVVVAAVLGAPFVLLYAVAWLLLPDVDGRIHLERLLRGTVDPAIVGIAVMAVIGLIPLVQGGWLGWRWWPDWPALWFGGIDVLAPLRVLWVLAIIAGVTVLVVWLVRRATQNSPGGGNGQDSRMASANAAAAPGSLTTPAATTDATTAGPGEFVGAAASDTASVTPDATTEPPVPAVGADADEIAEWRAQHEAWRRSHAEWRESQQNAERAARTRAALENKAKAQALAAESEAARRIRRAERPRASAAYVFTVLGIALVSASIAAISALGAAALRDFVPAIALAVAVIVLAVGMFMAAVRRRRSGFLAFVTAFVTVAMLIAAVAPARTIVPPSYGLPLTESGTYFQPVGDAYFTAFDDGESSTTTPEIELTQWVGDVQLRVFDDTRVVLDARDAGPVEVTELSADGSVARPSQSGDADGLHTFGGSPGQSADARLVVRQQNGTIYVIIEEGAGR